MSAFANLEAERAVIGGILVNPATLVEAMAELEPADFQFPEHRAIFAAMIALDAAGHRIEFSAVATEARLAKSETLTEAMISVVTTENLGYYARRVAARARRMRWQHTLARVMAKAQDPDCSDLDFFDHAMGELEKIDPVAKRNRSLATMREALAGVQQRLEEKHQGTQAKRNGGLLFGHDAIDLAIGGLRPGNLVVVAGRPGSGKTSLGVQAMMQTNPDIGWLVFSAEMDRYEVAERVLQADGLDMRAARAGRMDADAWKKTVNSISRHSDPIRAWIDDMGEEGTMSVAEIRTAARHWRAKQGAHLKQFGIIIDYFQLLKITNKFRREGLDQASRDLKALAKVMGCPIVLLSQLNREMEKEDRRPRLSDLRECGQLEADADVVLFTYRPEQHATEDKTANELRGKAELIIAKNRHGNTGIVYAKFDGERSRFISAPTQDAPTAPPATKRTMARGGYTAAPEDSE